ncbi:MAG: hypothetical protein JST32_10165 [Bacteroidetes bacterium]|nr:hypothetical protein [Bacteroidota bacterium]
MIPNLSIHEYKLILNVYEKRKLSLKGIKNVLSRDEMKMIMAGSGSGSGCVVNVQCHNPDLPFWEQPNCCNGCLPYGNNWVCS